MLQVTLPHWASEQHSGACGRSRGFLEGSEGCLSPPTQLQDLHNTAAILLLLRFKFDIENNYIFIFNNFNQPTIFFASNRVDCTDLRTIMTRYDPVEVIFSFAF